MLVGISNALKLDSELAINDVENGKSGAKIMPSKGITHLVIHGPGMAVLQGETITQPLAPNK